MSVSRAAHLFSSILAHLAHLACAFSLILNRIDKLMFWFKHASTRKHISEQSWLSEWIILNILAHLAHLAQSFFSDFQRNECINCPWFDLTNKKIYSDWIQKLGKKWSMLPTFFLRAIAAINRHYLYFMCYTGPNVIDD